MNAPSHIKPYGSDNLSSLDSNENSSEFCDCLYGTRNLLIRGTDDDQVLVLAIPRMISDGGTDPSATNRNCIGSSLVMERCAPVDPEGWIGGGCVSTMFSGISYHSAESI